MRIFPNDWLRAEWKIEKTVSRRQDSWTMMDKVL